MPSGDMRVNVMTHANLLLLNRGYAIRMAAEGLYPT